MGGGHGGVWRWLSRTTRELVVEESGDGANERTGFEERRVTAPLYCYRHTNTHPTTTTTTTTITITTTTTTTTTPFHHFIPTYDRHSTTDCVSERVSE